MHQNIIQIDLNREGRNTLNYQSEQADVLKQIICKVEVRRALTTHDNIDFASTVTKISKIKPLLVVVADKAYDSEDNHVLIREKLNRFSIIPSRYENVLIWKTKGRYRKKR